MGTPAGPRNGGSPAGSGRRLPHPRRFTLAAFLCLLAVVTVTADQDVARPRMPAEFETQDALILGTAQMVQFHPQALVDIVAAAHERIRVVSLASSREERDEIAGKLLDAGLPVGCVIFFYLPVATMWARDYGPLSVIQPDGRPHFLDASYTTIRANEVDDAVPQHLGRLLNTPVSELPLTLEGGDLLSNGQGLCLSSQRVISRNEQERGYDLQTVWALLNTHFGFNDWLPLPSLVGEPTGHVDMFLTLLASDLAVVGRYDPAIDEENAARLDWCARTLTEKTWNEQTIRVERIPMPPHDDGLWRTYTNVVFANGALLVPTYPDRCPDLDAEALALYARLLPDWDIVPIDATSLITRNGALHCVSMNLPVVEDSLR